MFDGDFYPLIPLRQLVRRITDGSHFSPTPREYGHPIANVKDMRAGAIDFNACTLISPLAYQGLKATGCTIKNGNVLLSKDGTVGRVVVYRQNEEIGALSSICIIEPDEVLDSGFLGHALQGQGCMRQYDNFMSGSAVRRLVLRDIRSIEVPIPNHKSQRAISQVLDALDSAIRESEAIIAKLKVVKQGLLRDLITRGINDNNELRASQCEAPHLYKKSVMGWIPKDWSLVELGAVLSSIDQGWSPNCEAVSANYNEWGVLKTTAITWAGYRDCENKALPPTLKARPDLEVACGDILVTRAGPSSRVGVVAHVASTRNKLMISDKIYRLRVLPENNSAYIAFAVSSQAVQSEIGRALSGMAESQTNISQKIVKRLLICRPSIEEQNAIVERITSCNARISEEVELMNKLLIFKSGLREDLLTGRVRVTPLLNPHAAT